MSDAPLIGSYNPDDVLAWESGGPRTARRFLSDVARLADSLPDRLAVLNLLSSRYEFLVGFAAETQHLVKHAEEKLAAKGLDLIVANDVTQAGAGFGSEQNAAVVLSRTGIQRTFALRPKTQLAHDILSTIVEFAKHEPRKPTPASVR